ncbi:MAG: glycosyltransferase family 2 protein [Lachnospiraceae bacterium]|nr:glycosyltransferase family 2 protein [Lachnospiraceae bacterium]
MSDKLYIVIPAYNEEDTIEEVVREWYPNILLGSEGSKLLVIDDGSKDGTGDKLKKLQEEFPLLEVKHKSNSGHGPTILAGYKHAIEAGADYVFQTDSDGQTNPNEFGEFWENRRKYEMIIGNRTDREDGFGRIVVTKTLRALIFATFHVYVKDANTPFRLMKATVLEKELRYIPKDYFLVNVLITVIFTKRKYRVRYVPITFKPRQGGTNSINVGKITGIGLKSIADFIKLNRIISK